MSLGRYTKSTGGTDFVALTSPTRGAANSAPKVGPVVLNEIMYNPAGEGDEFIELFNSGASAVNLFDPANPANTWKFTSGIDFAFPTGQTLPAGGYALVVPIDPATFRSKYGVPAGVQIYGPYAGNLDNKGEAIELSRPGVPQGGGVIPEIVVDHVTYQDSTPWPTQPDGDGPSLSRLVATDYGNHAGNWGTGALNGTPGKANRAFDSTPPTVPTGLTVLLGGVNTTINLAWNPSVDPDSGVAYYKIYRNNGLHATSTTPNYSDVNVPLGIQFDYRISAVNADGVEIQEHSQSARQSSYGRRQRRLLGVRGHAARNHRLAGRAGADRDGGLGLEVPRGRKQPRHGLAVAELRRFRVAARSR